MFIEKWDRSTELSVVAVRSKLLAQGIWSDAVEVGDILVDTAVDSSMN